MTNVKRTLIKQISFNKTIGGTESTKEIPSVDGVEGNDVLWKIVYEAKE